MIQYHFSAEETGFEMIVKINQESVHYANKYGSGWQNIASVLYASKDEDGQYYWGCFEDYCDQEIVADRDSFLQFLTDSDDKGYSVGAFDTIEEVNADIDNEALVNYIPVFGTFEKF